MATITLTNSHGAFSVDTARLQDTISRTGAMTLRSLRVLTAGCCCYSSPEDLADCNRLELQIILTESGNY